MLVVFSTILFACGKGSKTPVVNPKIELDEKLYYTTNQTLSEVTISLGGHDTDGKISWVDPSLYVKMGLNEYEWKFVPSDDKYKSTSGMIEILGYKIVNYTGINDIQLTKTGEDLKSTIIERVEERFGADCTVAIPSDYETNVIENGEYLVPVKLTAKQYRLVKVLGEPNVEAVVNVKVFVGKSLPTIANIPDATYNGKSQKPIMSIPNLVENVDYTLFYEYSSKEGNFEYLPLDKAKNNFVNAGSYRIVIEGKGNYYGKIVKQYTIKKMYFAKTINEVDNAIYKGESQQPNVVIDGMTENVDYTLTYFYRNSAENEFVQLDRTVNNFLSVGEYKIVATPRDNYTGNSVSTIYTIEKAKLHNIDSIEDAEFNGTEQKPSVVVGALIENVDYIIKYWEYASLDDENFVEVDNPEFINAGKYRVTVEGISNYKGEKTALYIINRKDVPEIESLSNVVYDGNTRKPSVVITGLVEGKDYELSYLYSVAEETGANLVSDDNEFVNAGIYTVVATGKGNYGSMTRTTFQILKADNELLEFVVTNWSYGEDAVDVIATANAGTPVVKYYKNSELADEMDKPTSSTDAGTYYVKVYVTADNYNDFVSETKELIISKSIAIVDSAESLAAAIPNGNYTSINIVGDIVLDSVCVFEKPVVLVQNVSLTITKNVDFDALLTVNGKLIVSADCIVTINQGLNVVGGSIENNGNIKCNVNDLEMLNTVINVCDIIVVNNDITAETNTSIAIKSSKLNFDLNGHIITGIKFIVEEKLSSQDLTFENTSRAEAKLVNNDVVFEISSGENVSIKLSNLTIESTNNSAIVTKRNSAGTNIVLDNCKLVATNNFATLLLQANYVYQISNCNISGGASVAIFVGDLTLTNSTITATTGNGELTLTEDQFTPTGSAIEVMNTGYGSIIIKLSGIVCDVKLLSYTENESAVLSSLTFVDVLTEEELTQQYIYEPIVSEKFEVHYAE